MMTGKIVVLVTCGSRIEAGKIARTLVKDRLAACANIIQVPVKSVYRWKGNVESASEFLLVIKTSRMRFADLQATIKRMHSYEVPEIIALPVAAGSRAYLHWVEESTRPARVSKKKYS